VFTPPSVHTAVEQPDLQQRVNGVDGGVNPPDTACRIVRRGGLTERPRRLRRVPLNSDSSRRGLSDSMLETKEGLGVGLRTGQPNPTSAADCRGARQPHQQAESHGRNGPGNSRNTATR